MKATRRERDGGFTSIELLIVMVIIGILLTIAIPSFMSQMRKGNRTDAKAIMMETAQFMERYYTTNRTYVGATVLNATTPKGASGSGIKYNISFSVAPAASVYALQAVPANAQASDTCGTLTLSNTGAQTAATANCW